MDDSRLTGHPMPGTNSAPEQGGYGSASHDVTVDELYGRMGPHVPTDEELAAAAQWWARERGLRIFPCLPSSKRPAVPRGFKAATTNHARIAGWFEGQFAGCNPATPTGAPGDDVLDVEGYGKPGGDGWAAFGRLKAAGLLAGAHRLVRTPSDGLHIGFAGSGQRSGCLRDLHVDFKAAGGYVLLPPSHINGHPYQLRAERPPSGAALDWDACKRLLRPPAPVRKVWVGRRGGRVDHLPEWMAHQAEGNRNAALHWAACRAAERGDQDVLAALVAAGVAAGLDEHEAQRTVASAVRSVNGER